MSTPHPDKELLERRVEQLISKASFSSAADKAEVLEIVRLTFAALRTAMQAADPEQRFEDYVQNLIDKAPNTRQLGERLAEWLDEDRFNNVNPQLLALARMEAATPQTTDGYVLVQKSDARALLVGLPAPGWIVACRRVRALLDDSEVNGGEVGNG